MDVIFRRRRLVFFVRWCVISVLTIFIPQILIDTQFYGKLTIAPLNIVTYNILTNHGPDLYGKLGAFFMLDAKFHPVCHLYQGTEPWTYYLFNGILNFNVAFILALLVYPALLLVHLLIPSSSGGSGQDSSTGPLFIPKWLALSGLFLWLGVFWAQPHKEERFLFPVYPLIALAAAVTMDW